MPPPLPPGYERVVAGRCLAVVHDGYRVDAEAMLAEGTLYEAAARDLAARSLAGRGIAYAIALPVSGTRVVVRHNRHGGALARLTRDAAPGTASATPLGAFVAYVAASRTVEELKEKCAELMKPQMPDS